MHRVYLALLVLIIGCAGRDTKVEYARNADEVPRVVVALVVDQLGAAQLLRYLPYLSEDGVFKTGMRQGTLYTKAQYDYAGTYTAPGHTAIYCGAGPWKCGVGTNYLWDSAKRGTFPSMDSGKFAVLGHEGRFASPERITAPTVADQLKDATKGQARVVSLSIKDRAAIPGGGRQSDLTLWFDASAGGFTTSTFFAEALPEWLQTWNAQHPLSGLIKPWSPADPDVLRNALGDDEQAGEGQCAGLGGSFPHDVPASQRPTVLFKMTPQSTSHLLDTALEAAIELDLGADDVTDFLAVSVSAVDYAGHAFGPESWEYLETFLRADQMLGAFVRELEKRTSIAVLVTADHGVGSLPEHTKQGGRIYAPTFAEELNGALEPVLGSGLYIDGYASPYFYLADNAPTNRDAVVSAAIKVLTAMPSVHSAYDVRDVLGRTDDPDPVVAAVARSVVKGQGGDIFVVPAEGFVVDEAPPEGHGTSHGTPWSYDNTVPVLVWGAGIQHGRVDTPVSMNRVATTLSWLLDVPAPPNAAPAPLGVSD